jgi:dolichol kinase
VSPHPDAPAAAAPPAPPPAAGAADEQWRRTLHVAAGGLAPLAAAVGPEHASVGFALLVILAASAEALRLGSARAAGFIARFVGPLFRPAEKRSVSGATTLAFGFALVWWLFPVGVAERAMLVVALADPMAATAGLWAGVVGRKSWTGTTACALTAGLVLLVTRVPLLPAALAAAAAALAERIPWRGVDNLAVPVVAAAVLQGLA